jgi:hypothetical protein
MHRGCGRPSWTGGGRARRQRAESGSSWISCDTDPALLAKISRRLINHLSWSGVSEAETSAGPGAARPPAIQDTEGNRPLGAPVHPPPATSRPRRYRSPASTSEADPQMPGHMDPGGKVGFLVGALEDQDTSLGRFWKP